MVTDETCVRRCNNCDVSTTVKLPKPTKKLIYLDQNAISLIVKVPLQRAPPKWTEVRTALEQALQMEGIICPHSEFHESESLLDKKFATELRSIYQHFAHGKTFRTSYEIQLRQIDRSLRRFASETEPEHEAWEDILRRDPNVWTDNFYLTVNSGRLEGVAKTTQQVKEQIRARLPDLNKAFKENRNSFEDQRILEIRQGARNILEIYKLEADRLRSCKNLHELVTAHMEGSIFSEHMRYVLNFFAERGADSDAKWELAIRFLHSGQFSEMSYINISSAAWAGISRRVGLGQQQVTASDFYDIPIISLYAPYCDAMLIDNAMRDLMTTNPVRDFLKLKTNFFSPNRLDEFISYIHDVIVDLPDEFTSVVRGVHGEWRAP